MANVALALEQKNINNLARSIIAYFVTGLTMPIGALVCMTTIAIAYPFSIYQKKASNYLDKIFMTFYLQVIFLFVQRFFFFSAA